MEKQESLIMIKNLREIRNSDRWHLAAWQVRVDRASILGNPFYMHSENERDLVCDKYKTYFEKQLTCNTKFVAELNRLLETYKQFGKLELLCWCYPKRCHAETIKAWLLNKIK